MKSSKRRTTAFISAFLIAISGMTGSFAPIAQSIAVYAEENAVVSLETLEISPYFFALTNDATVDFYVFTKNAEGNIDFKDTESRRVVLTINKDSEKTTLPNIKANEVCIAYRHIANQQYDYYVLEEDGSGWIYLGTDFNKANKLNTIQNWIDTDLDLNEQYVGKNNEIDISAFASISYTCLDEEHTTRTIVNLKGSLHSNIKIPKDYKYSYLLKRNSGGYNTDAQANTETISRWDTETQSWGAFAVSGKNQKPIVLPLFVNDAHFPMLESYDVQEVRIYRNGELMESFDKETYDGGWGAVTQKFERGDGSTTMGFCYGGDYEQYSWEATVKASNEYERVSESKEAVITGKFLANIPYATQTSVTKTDEYEVWMPEPAEQHRETEVVEVPVILPPSVDYYNENYNANSNVRVLDDTSISEETTPTAIVGDGADSAYKDVVKGNHGNVYLIRNTEVIDSYTAGDFDAGVFQLPEFDRTSVYFLKIAVDDTEQDYIYYRWSEEEGKWQFRVNTAETPIATVPLTHAELVGGTVSSDFQMNLKLVSGDVETDVLKSWTKEEFDAGTITAEIPFALAGNFVIELSGSGVGQPMFGYQKAIYHESMTYQFVGIDPVWVHGEITEENVDPIPMAEPPVREYRIANVEELDNIKIDGVDKYGSPVHYELVSEWKYDEIPVMEGTYTITDETAGYQAEVLVEKDENGELQVSTTDKSTINNSFLNLTVPVEDRSYSLEKPDGTLIVTGALAGDKVETLQDIDISGNKLAKTTNYALLNSEAGIVNSVNPDDVVKENCYVYVKDGELNKADIDTTSLVIGDVDLSGSLTVTDLVKQSKYLKNAESYSIEEFITGDCNKDGVVNIIDLALMKRELLK